MVTFPRRFTFKMSFICTSKRWLIDTLTLWMITNEENAALIPKIKLMPESFPEDFCTRNFFGGEVSRYAATPLIVTLSPGHSDITKFRLWSPIVRSNDLDRAEKIPKILLRRMAPFTFFIRVQAFRDPTSLRASSCPNLRE
jgi:hypothetical protein